MPSLKRARRNVKRLACLRPEDRELVAWFVSDALGDLARCDHDAEGTCRNCIREHVMLAFRKAAARVIAENS